MVRVSEGRWQLQENIGFGVLPDNITLDPKHPLQFSVILSRGPPVALTSMFVVSNLTGLRCAGSVAQRETRTSSGSVRVARAQTPTGP